MQEYEKLLQRILEKVGLERASVIEERVQKLLSEDSRLTRIGALYLVADELGVFEEPVRSDHIVPISRLVGGLQVVNVKARVLGVNGPITAGPTSMTILRLGDGTGVVSAVAWGDPASKMVENEIVPGDALIIRNAYTKERIDGRVEIHIGRSGTVERVEGTDVPPLDDFFKPLPEVLKIGGEVDFKAHLLALSEKRSVRTGEREVSVREALLGWEGFTAPFVAWSGVSDILDGLQLGDLLYISAARREGTAISSTPRTCIYRARRAEGVKGAIKLKILDELSIDGGKEYIATDGVSIFHVTGEGLSVGLVLEATDYEYSPRRGRWVLALKGYRETEIDTSNWTEGLVSIDEVADGMADFCLRGVILSKTPRSLVKTKHGEVESVSFWLKEDDKTILCRAWRQHAELIDRLEDGRRLILKWIRAKANRWGGLEVHVDGYAKIDPI